MNLSELKEQPYDLVASLGQNCDPASYLRVHGLRKFSMPLDWVVSSSLSDVNRLLRNRFSGYMNLSHMRPILGISQYVDESEAPSGQQQLKSYFIKDTQYNIVSVHDFPIVPLKTWRKTYPAYYDKLSMRMGRFLQGIDLAKSVLFVRYFGSYEQTLELESVLSTLTNREFCILLVNPVPNLKDVVEVDWGLRRVCSVQIPSTDNKDAWYKLLGGIRLV
ncbi:DUF1796 family putative cysteine peptidase [Paenibacillus hexagrammi]|uniref:Papain-like cysteine peptidase n=1 Tax=Paenibacillus hexagrammi TaxID=2908839 RepID=A0ABY3SDX6_9BACL|nr:DUF1796 family putative cysteine peptidase [Paenibacillus sp. YPD9-1]UJF32182.1 papain-like cysteine peptidase [Paenibacillus sp. YPD9-1]